MLTSADFSRFDTIAQDGYLSADELSAANESMSAWDTDNDQQVSRQEWESGIDDMETVRENQGTVRTGFLGKTNFAAHTGFEGADFGRIDTEGDGVITREEWNRANLDSRLFGLIAGQSGSITENDWYDYITAQDQGGRGTSAYSTGKQ